MSMNPNHNRKRGKRNEAAIARRLGGKRMGILGKDDIQTSDYSIECKSRTRFGPERWLEQAERNALATKKTAISIVHVTGKEHGKDIVMLRLKDWESLMGVLHDAVL